MDTKKPYLIRAVWQWCVDQGTTPYLAVVVDEHTQVPAGYVKDGQITLNVGLDATNQLDIGNEFVAFQARFGGVAQQIFVPIERVAAIYARESGDGMGFDVTDTEQAKMTPAQEETQTADRSVEKPVISNIKAVETIDKASSEGSNGPPDEPSPPSGGARPRFTVVK